MGRPVGLALAPNSPIFARVVQALGLQRWIELQKGSSSNTLARARSNGPPSWRTDVEDRRGTLRTNRGILRTINIPLPRPYRETVTFEANLHRPPPVIVAGLRVRVVADGDLLA